MTSTLTPIQIEVIGSVLESICEEMGEALIKASFSPNVKERRDCTTAIFDLNGQALAQAEHIPIHLGSLIGIVSAITAVYPINEIRPGDSFIGNDPYSGGGTHLPDIVLVTPLFAGSRLIAWAANLAHHADYAERGHENIFQEGLRIPVTRFLREWEFVPDVLRMILTNMQVPAERVADFKAQVSANRLAANRFSEICDEYGVDVVMRGAAGLLDYTERKTRAAIAAIPDGRYEFGDVFECNELPDPVDLFVAVTVAGDEIRLDFEAPAQVRAGINMVETALLATVYYAIKSLVGPGIPANSGLHRPITVSAPIGSLINCVAPAAVHSRVQVCQRIVDLVYGALAPVLPERVTGAANGAVSSMQFSGIDPRTGKFYVYVESIGGGNGGGSCYDGLDGVQAHITNSSNLPVENLEAEYPIIVEAYELIDGSGGVGTFRGGMGVHRRVRVEHDDALCEINISRVSTRPWGIFGGGPGTASRAEVNGKVDNGVLRRVQRNDIVSIFTAGGGGYGPPLDREPTLVEQDLREQRISPQVASESYGAEMAKEI